MLNFILGGGEACPSIVNAHSFDLALWHHDKAKCANLHLHLQGGDAKWVTVRPLIKGTPKEDKPPNKGQAVVYTVHAKRPPKEDNLSVKDKMLGAKCVSGIADLCRSVSVIWRFPPYTLTSVCP